MATKRVTNLIRFTCSHYKFKILNFWYLELISVIKTFWKFIIILIILIFRSRIRPNTFWPNHICKIYRDNQRFNYSWNDLFPNKKQNTQLFGSTPNLLYHLLLLPDQTTYLFSPLCRTPLHLHALKSNQGTCILALPYCDHQVVHNSSRYL